MTVDMLFILNRHDYVSVSNTYISGEKGNFKSWYIFRTVDS